MYCRTLATAAWVSFCLSLPAALVAQDAVQLGRHIEDAQQFFKQGRYAQAVQAYQQALPIAQQIFGGQHQNVGVILGETGRVWWTMNEPAKAKPYLEGAVKIYERSSNAQLISEGINNLAGVYVELGQFKEAQELHEKCLKLMQSLHGPESAEYAISLGNLAGVHHSLGQDEKAEPLLQRSADLLARAGAKHANSLAHQKMNLANLYLSRSDFVRAEPLYLDSIATAERIHGANHLETARIRTNLAALYQSVGQLDKAAAEHQRCLQIFRATLGDSLDAARSIANLASIYTHQKKFQEAEDLYRQAIAIRVAKLGPEHPDVALSLMAFGVGLQRAKRFKEAREVLEQSLAIRRKSVGENTPVVADSLTALGLLAVREGKPEMAQQLFEQELEIRRGAQPVGHPDLANSHANLGLAHASQKQWQNAAREFDTARKGVRRFINQVLPGLSDREQLVFLRERDEPIWHATLQLPLLSAGDSEIVSRSAEWALNGKAVAEQALAQRGLATRDSTDPKLAKLATELQGVRKQLAAAMYADAANQDAAARARMEMLIAKEESLSRSLTVPTGRAVLAPWVTLEELRARMPANSLFVNFVRVHAYDFVAAELDRERPSRYVAWLARQDVDEVAFVDLGDAEAIDRCIQRTRKAISGAAERIPEVGEELAAKELQSELSTLASLILHPLFKASPPPQHLLLSPDAHLWLVPWSALPVSETKLAVEEFSLQYLVSGRELVEQSTYATSTRPVLFADPAYDLDPNAVRAATRQIFRQPETDTATIRATKPRFGAAAPLPNTRVEAAAVQPSIQALTSQEPWLYLGKFALEAVFKTMRNPRVLMLSTHGFFQEPTATNGGGLHHPLLGCGLLLAGCNHPPALPSPDLEDGILTGLEIIQTDLRGTELVVLSACETGLGEVRNGEGIAGLRQAFHLGGAQAIVSTLWQIPDRESALIMNNFFANLAAGQQKAEALRHAQLKLIAARRERYGQAHPFYWAAWTVTGN